MALTRKMLKAMELDDDKIAQIIDAHQGVIDEIAAERDAAKAEAEKYKADAEKLVSVQKELEKANMKLEDAEKVSEKLKAVQDEFATYKDDVAAKETHAAKEKAFRDLLAQAGISGKRMDSIIKVSDLAKIEFDKDGNVKDAKAIVDGIKSEWADFIVTQGTQGAQTSTPPANEPKKAYNADDLRHMSAEEINKNWDSIKESLKNI